MSKLADYAEQRKAELNEDRQKLHDALMNATGFSTPRPVQFANDLHVRDMIVDEIRRFAEHMDKQQAAPRTPRKAAE